MVGSIFLWMFWPSFNGCLASDNTQHRVVVNTVLAISCSNIGAFMTSNLLNNGFYKMEDALNATLAGGVMIGTSCDLFTNVSGAMTVGFAAGILSAIGFNKLTEILNDKLGIHDTCGVNNLHGLPGIIAGIIGAICTANASQSVYGNSLYSMFSEMEKGRTAREQMGYQFAALFSSFSISLVSGILTGLIIRCKAFNSLTVDQCFDDALFWLMEDNEKPLDMRIKALEKGDKKFIAKRKDTIAKW